MYPTIFNFFWWWLWGLYSERNQAVIMSKGGAQLLAQTASRTEDPQTLRMVAGALANLCGNGKLEGIHIWKCFEV